MRGAGRRNRQTTGGEADLSTLTRVLPDLWPADQPGLRVRVVLSLLMLVLAKVAAILSPFLFGWSVDALAPTEAHAMMAAPALLVIAWGVARLSSTVFQQLRDVIFARVGQHALRRLGLRTFEHIHRLSLGFHISRKTGALSRIVDRGIKAIEFLLRYLVFSIVPLGIELLIISGIFLVGFGVWYLVILAGTIAAYVFFTFKVTEWRVKIRMEMNAQDQDAHQKAVDSLLNYETVKYFSAEEREASRYDSAMAAYQKAALKTAWSLGALNIGQAFILAAGTVTVMTMTALQVVGGSMTVGQFVMVNAFMIQITMPLNFLGTVYREIRQSLVDMREMYAVVDQAPGVIDATDAPDLEVSKGAVAFRNVAFGYGEDRVILEDVSLDIPAGKTLAVVGASGAGKSTLARLLFRFYDVTSGAVEIDGQDLTTVTQASVRRAIGVVPQDTVLFNDTIGYNIGYGRDDATREEIEAAAVAARVHDFIQTLPEGYDTVVGERGLKLSGGEKQRVAIARTILKNPPILILDEATSALDTTTEREIQAELRRLSENRTVLMIAHRLSTVVDADEIAVIDKGRVAERGSHAALLSRGGLYAALWQRQEVEKDGEAAA